MPLSQADDDGIDARGLGATKSAGPKGRLSGFTHFDEWFVQKTLSSHLHIFCDWNIHPNAISGLSLAVAAAIPFLHYRRLLWWVAASIVLRQILDCLDGEVARRCHKTSKAGAMLDAIGDTVFFFVLLTLLISFFTPNPLRVLFISGVSFGLISGPCFYMQGISSDRTLRQKLRYPFSLSKILCLSGQQQPGLCRRRLPPLQALGEIIVIHSLYCPDDSATAREISEEARWPNKIC